MNKPVFVVAWMETEKPNSNPNATPSRREFDDYEDAVNLARELIKQGKRPTLMVIDKEGPQS